MASKMITQKSFKEIPGNPVPSKNGPLVSKSVVNDGLKSNDMKNNSQSVTVRNSQNLQQNGKKNVLMTNIDKTNGSQQQQKLAWSKNEVQKDGQKSLRLNPTLPKTQVNNSEISKSGQKQTFGQKPQQLGQSLGNQTNNVHNVQMSKNDNSAKPGQKANVTNKISNSLVSPNKMEPLQTSVKKSDRPNDVVSKSLPNRIQEIPNLGQTGQINRMSKPQADGLVSQNRSLQKPTGRNEVQTRGQNQGTQSNMQQLYQTGQKSGNQVNNAQKSLQTVKKTGNQIQNTQQSPKMVQKPGNQINNAQKSLQTIQKQGNQTNYVQIDKQIGQKPGNPANNAQKLQQNGQRPRIQTNNANKTQQVNNLQKSQMGKNEMPSKTGQKANIPNNTSQLQGSSNSKNPPPGKIIHQPIKKQGQKDQTGKSIRNEQSVGRSGLSQGGKNPSDKKKKKKKRTERRSQPVRPQIIEYPARTTSIPLAEAQLLLREIDNMKGDGKYDSLAEFLSQLLQKVQNLETGNYSRTEIELCVRQFQDYNEGFHYRMESKPRGLAVILTNSEFYKVPGDPWSYDLDNRPGAEIDAAIIHWGKSDDHNCNYGHPKMADMKLDNFEKLLTDMGYLVTRRGNIKHWEMAWELKCMAEMEHKKFDSFICVISSHGNLNQVFGCDGLKMTLSKEIRQFRSEKCPSLAGKPKLFFLQSCQTDLEDLSFRTDSTIPVDGNTKPKPGELERSRFLINDVDFLVGYSTLPGNLSYRHEQTGSWYLDALYQNLKENHNKYDLVSILEDVNYDVCCKKDQYNFIDSSSQVSMFSSTLRGPVLFH